MAFRLPTFKVRLWRKLSIATVIVVFLLTFLLLGQGFVADDTAHPPSYLQQRPKSPRCSSRNLTAAAEAWRRTEDRYKDLIEDKFTVALSTFHRPKELDHTLGTLLSVYIPSLYEIVVVWNNLDQEPPEDFISSHGVPVRYRVPSRDSLNEKLRPDPTYRTKAILLSDDDVYYRPSDLDYVFQMWRQFGQDRLVGALARCASLDRRGQWQYHFCHRGEGAGAYSIVLTNLAFAHIGFLDYYFSDAPEAVSVRDHVDAQFNCEDIGLNTLASMLTRRGPLLVRGSEQWVNLSPPSGISRNPHHLETRSACLNRFAEAIGCMPLVDEMGRVERGYKHNVWYKSFWDRLGT